GKYRLSQSRSESDPGFGGRSGGPAGDEIARTQPVSVGRAAGGAAGLDVADNGRGRGMIVAIVGALCLVMLAVTFAVQNAQVVQVSFLSWAHTGSLAMVLMLTFSVGLAAGYLAALPTIIRRMHSLAGCRRRLQELEARQPGQESLSAGKTDQEPGRNS